MLLSVHVDHIVSMILQVMSLLFSKPFPSTALLVSKFQAPVHVLREAPAVPGGGTLDKPAAEWDSLNFS